jgi:hypothetical protein
MFKTQTTDASHRRASLVSRLADRLAQAARNLASGIEVWTKVSQCRPMTYPVSEGLLSSGDEGSLHLASQFPDPEATQRRHQERSPTGGD